MKRAVLLAAVAAGLVVGARPAPARPPRAAEIRALIAEGEVEKVLAALKKKKVTPADLLEALREPRRPEVPGAPGHTQHELKDGHGRKTDLHVVAPSADAIQSRAKAGLGLVVCLHGLRGSGKQVVPLATELAATGEVVVVAPSAQPIPAGIQPEDGCPDYVAKRFPHWWLYESNRSFTFEAIRTARAMFPIDPDRIVLAGVSMGGYGTWNQGLRHADRFAGMAPLAGGLSRLEQVGFKDDRTRSLLVNGKLFPSFVVHGDKDEVVPYGPDKEAADKLKELGGECRFETIEGGGHDIRDAVLGSGKLAEDLRSFLVSKRRQHLPREVAYASLSEKLDGAYWLRIATRTQKDARLEGKVDRAKNRIQLSGENVSLARVYIDDRLLDLAKPVTIEGASGEVRFRGKVQPEARAIVESWRSREDERLVYPAFVEVDPR